MLSQKVFKKIAKKVDDKTLYENDPSAAEALQYLPVVGPIFTPSVSRRAGIASGLSNSMGKEAPFTVKWPTISSLLYSLGGMAAGTLVGGLAGGSIGGIANGKEGAEVGLGLGLYGGAALGGLGGAIANSLVRNKNIKKIIKEYKETPESKIDPKKINPSERTMLGYAFNNPNWWGGLAESKAMHV